ncbi:T9SS type A sorting domain-containing protein, partial [Bacteroidota bacterium]
IFLGDSIGYVCGSSFQYYGALYKTTNAGQNWLLLNTPFGTTFDDMFVLNEDTIWVTDGAGYFGGLFRTTNGGQSWTRQIYSMGTNPDVIYMYNGKQGFFSLGSGPGNNLYRTTNSGENWIKVLDENGFLDMYFFDSLKGYKAYGLVKKTTDGGLTWQTQTLPPVGGLILTSSIISFSILNSDTIWGVGAEAFFYPGQFRGLIYKTTNGGESWGYQLPDTSIHISQYHYVDFIYKLNGWAYSYWSSGGVHTVTGGDDTTIYVEMKPITTEIPGGYRLHQNYPNPFNYSTRIKFDISKTSDIKLKIYNLLGEEIDEIVNNKLSAGSYDFRFIGSELPSGVYLCRLVVDDNKIDTKKMILIK